MSAQLDHVLRQQLFIQRCLAVEVMLFWNHICMLEATESCSMVNAKFCNMHVIVQGDCCQANFTVYCCKCSYSNVILTEPDGTILLCAYQVGSKMSRARQLQTGGSYQLPPKPQGIQPDLNESFASWQTNITQAAQMLSSKTAQPAASVARGMVRAYQVHPSTMLYSMPLYSISPHATCCLM